MTKEQANAIIDEVYPHAVLRVWSPGIFAIIDSHTGQFLSDEYSLASYGSSLVAVRDAARRILEDKRATNIETPANSQ